MLASTLFKSELKPEGFGLTITKQGQLLNKNRFLLFKKHNFIYLILYTHSNLKRYISIFPL